MPRKSAPPAQPTSPVTPKKTTPTYVKYYLLGYNALSTGAWLYILFLTLAHLLYLPHISPSSTAGTTKTASAFSRLVSSLPFVKTLNYVPELAVKSRIPPFLQPLYHRLTTAYARVGMQTAFVQSFAILEVLHVLLKWVGSPIQTTAMQVSSRLFLVWAITERFEVARSNPLYATMILAWSATEVIRYAYYACNLAGREPDLLAFLRYTTFFVLYPLGAGSEAFLIYSTLPPFSSWKSWHPMDYGRAVLFAVWWPGLYVMYTHMMQQRRKVFANGPSRTKSKAL